MKRVIPAAAFAAALGALAAPSDASAEGMNGNGFYFGAAAGAALRGDDDITSTAAGVSTDSTVEYDPAAAFAGYIGYDFGKVRADVEVRYASNSVDSISGTTSSDGDVSNLAVMANAYYDFRLKDAKITPYVGGGLGFVNVSADVTSTSALGDTTVDDSDIVLGGQVIAGAAYPLNDRVSLTADYRFMYAAEPSFDGDVAGTAGAVESDASAAHHFMLGLRVGF